MSGHASSHVSAHAGSQAFVSGGGSGAALAFDDVAIRLGGRRVLSGASFAIPPGAFVAVLGPNGAGKTTLMRAVLGLVPVASGRITIGGVAPRRGNPAIGYMPQFRRGAAQLGLTGFDLVLGALGHGRWGRPFASGADRRAAAAALDEVDAAALARRPVSELSGGERQRVLFAQALLGEPGLLLLDEPLANLDPGHGRGIVEAVRRVARRRGATVLFCAHEINPLLGAADLVLYLGHGDVAVGPVDTVINADVLSRLYRTPIHVAKLDGRIYVVARDGDLAAHAHRDGGPL